MEAEAEAVRAFFSIPTSKSVVGSGLWEGAPNKDRVRRYNQLTVLRVKIRKTIPRLICYLYESEIISSPFAGVSGRLVIRSVVSLSCSDSVEKPAGFRFQRRLALVRNCRAGTHIV